MSASKAAFKWTNQAGAGITIYPRWIEQRIQENLADTRFVLLSGPRQAGKTTLVKKLTGESTRYLTLDDANTLAAAKDGVLGYLGTRPGSGGRV